MLDSPRSDRATPARLTASAAARLPRPLLLAVCLTYIVFGLFLRDPWKTDDVIGLAQMWTAAHLGGISWVTPMVGHTLAPTNGPLTVWVGGASLAAFGPWLGDIVAGRLPNLLWFGFSAMAVWYGTYLLGRRPDAQPLALPFGGQPAPRDYGRMLADAALLLWLGTLGLAWPTHETSATPAALAAQAVAFYALVRMREQPWGGALLLGLALAGAALSRGGTAVLPLALALPLVLRWRWRDEILPLVALTLPLALVLPALWWLAAWHAQPHWAQAWQAWHGQQFGLLQPDGALSVVRNLPWFLWPLWPLAILAVWRWRGWYRASHLRIPLGMTGAALLGLMFLQQPDEADLLALVVPGAALAALALPTLRRGQVNALDWFAVMAFSVAGLLVWFGWMTALTGWPVKIAGNIARQTPGFQLPFQPLAVFLALLATLAWGALLNWRLRNHPAALWRGTMLSAGGVMLTWVLLVTLWLPSIDYARSYRPVADAVATVVARQDPGACVRSQQLGLAQRASFAVFRGLVFDAQADCPLVFQQTLQGQTPALPAGAQLLWQGTRPADRSEWFRLYRLP